MPDEVIVQLSPDRIPMDPGGRPVEVTLTIQNRSDNAAEYTVEVTGLEADWFTPPPARVRLFMQDREQVRFALRPPGRARKGSYVYRVVVRSIDGSAQASAEGTLEVSGVVAYRLELEQRRQTGRGQATFQVQVVNTGTAELRTALDAQDAGGECQVRFIRDASPRVPVGATVKVPLHVRPFQRPWIGPERSYEFSVTARPDDPGVAPQNITGQFTHRPWLVSWAPVRNTLLVIAAVGLVFVVVAALVPVGVAGPLGGVRAFACNLPVIGSLCGRRDQVATCTYDEGFKAYALAESQLIGPCVTSALSDSFGNVRQYTKNGILFWQNASNTVYFFRGDSLYGFINDKSTLIHGSGAV